MIYGVVTIAAGLVNLPYIYDKFNNSDIWSAISFGFCIGIGMCLILKDFAK
jgi:hypothetical protein